MAKNNETKSATKKATTTKKATATKAAPKKVNTKAAAPKKEAASKPDNGVRYNDDIIKALAVELEGEGIQKKAIHAVLTALPNVVAAMLADGKQVRIHHLVSIKQGYRPKRKIHNLVTHKFEEIPEAILLSARTSICLKRQMDAGMSKDTFMALKAESTNAAE